MAAGKAFEKTPSEKKLSDKRPTIKKGSAKLALPRADITAASGPDTSADAIVAAAAVKDFAASKPKQKVGRPIAKSTANDKQASLHVPAHESWPAHVHARLLEKLRGISSSLRSYPLKAEQVHRARRLLKEANALTRLLEGCCGSDAREASRGFANLRHRLNDVRDLDVIELALKPFLPDLPITLQTDLTEAIAERRSHLNERTNADEPGSMRKELQKLSKSISAWDLAKASPEALAVSARRTYKTLRYRGTLAFENHEDEALHDLRKPLIMHRYQIEALERAWPKLFRAWAMEAQLLRDKLGEHHDLMMVGVFAKEAVGKEAAPLLHKVASAQQTLVKEAEPIFDRLCTEKPGAFERRLLACLSNAKKRIGAPDVAADETETAEVSAPASRQPKKSGKAAAKSEPAAVRS